MGYCITCLCLESHETSFFCSLCGKMFEKSLNDLVRGIRAHKGQEVSNPVAGPEDFVNA